MPPSELQAADGSPDEAEVVHVPEQQRYELRLSGRLVGIAEYKPWNGALALTHTEVERSCWGRGLGSRLAEGALEDIRRQDLRVVAFCPFIARFIEQHPEYQELLAS